MKKQEGTLKNPRAEKAEVKLGQRYEDMDKRYPGRVVEVVGLEPQSDGLPITALVKTPSGRKVSIQVRRLQGKWYRLLGTKKQDEV